MSMSRTSPNWQYIRQSFPPSMTQEILSQFLAANPQRCEGTTVDDLANFFSIVNMARFSGIDLKSVLITLEAAGLIPPVQGMAMTRVDRMNFARETTGIRGKSKDVKLPSLMYSLLYHNCGSIRTINDVLARVHFKQNLIPTVAGKELMSRLPAQTLSQVENQVLMDFLKDHPKCQTQEESIRKLLALIDANRGILSGTNVTALVRLLGIQGRLPMSAGTSKTVVNNLSLRPPTANTGKSVKQTLLWSILDGNCERADVLLSQLASLVAEARAKNTLPRPSSTLENLLVGVKQE